jgi:GAF domain-containing protein
MHFLGVYPNLRWTESPSSAFILLKEAVMAEERSESREVLLARALLEMGDTLIDELNIVGVSALLVSRCVEILGVSTAGLMLADPEGDLRAVASSNEAMRMVELFELDAEEGPCLDCYRTAEVVTGHDMAADSDRWPKFAPVALDAGYGFAHGIPMRWRGRVIGALNLFRTDKSTSDEFDLIAGQALADMATIAILQQRAVTEAQLLNEQLNFALNSRILVAQAKDVVAARLGVELEHALSRLSNHAGEAHREVASVAGSVVEHTARPASSGGSQGSTSPATP